MFNMHETQPLILVAAIAGSLVAPATVVRLMLAYAVFRFIYAIGYTSKPILRMAGFIPGVLCESSILALGWILGLKYLGVLSAVPSFFVPNALQQ